MKIICIPYAGGTAESFDELKDFLPAGCELCAVEYAGHGSRRKASYYETFDEMVQDAARQISGFLNSGGDKEPFVLFGYSMGTIVTYELFAQKLLERMPGRVVLACHEPPDVKWEAAGYRFLSDEVFLQHMRDMGGLPGCDVDKLSNRFFRKLVFEPIRKDYELLGKYVFWEQVRIEVPVRIIYSPDDITPEKMTGWKKFLGEDAGFVPMGSSHFLIREVPEQVSEVLCGD